MIPRSRKWLVLICATVVFLATSAQLSHFHPEALVPSPLSKQLPSKSGATCLLCNALHAPALASTTAAIAITIAFSAEAVPEAPRSVVRINAFDLQVRPPPSLA